MTTTDHTDTRPGNDEAADPREHDERPSPAPTRIGMNTDTLALGSFFIAVFAMLAALVAVALAARSIDEHRAVQATEAPAGAAAGDATNVSLAEFSISPDPIQVAAGGSLSVTNEGAIVHNLSVEGNSTPMLDPAGSASLDLSGLEPGTYTIICDVSGHAAAGMEATLTVG